MSTIPERIYTYEITQTSARLEWYINGDDTELTDVLCYPLTGSNTMSGFEDSTVVFRKRNISTPATQEYSIVITGLKPSTRYAAALHSKSDIYGAGMSALARVEFTTLDDPNGDPSQTALAKQLVYVKTNIAGYFFDAVMQTNYSRSLTITQHPVETGAAITDHAYVNPVELTMQIQMTDVAESIISAQFAQGSSRSITAFQVLVALQAQRIPMQVMCRLGLFKNMLIESIACPDDYTTLYGLKATVTLREVFVAVVQTVKISARPQTTEVTNKAVVEPVTPSKSILKSVIEKAGSLFPDDGTAMTNA